MEKLFILLFSLSTSLYFSQNNSLILKKIEKEKYSYEIHHSFRPLSENELNEYIGAEKQEAKIKNKQYIEFDDFFLTSYDDVRDYPIVKVTTFPASSNRFESFKLQAQKLYEDYKDGHEKNGMKMYDISINEKIQSVDILYRDSATNLIMAICRFFSNDRYVQFEFVFKGENEKQDIETFILHKVLVNRSFNFK